MKFETIQLIGLNACYLSYSHVIVGALAKDFSNYFSTMVFEDQEVIS